MTQTDYFNFLVTRLRRFFNIHYKKTLSDVTFDIYGAFHQRNARYLVTKELEFYAFENNEYLLYKDHGEERITTETLGRYRELLAENYQEIIKTDEDHMESIIILLLTSTAPIEPRVARMVRRFRFHKSFKFGFGGWVNAKLLIYNPESGEYFGNKYGRRLEANFIPGLKEGTQAKKGIIHRLKIKK